MTYPLPFVFCLSQNAEVSIDETNRYTPKQRTMVTDNIVTVVRFISLMHICVAYIVDNNVLENVRIANTRGTRCVCVCVWEGGRGREGERVVEGERGERERALAVQQESIAMRDPKLAPLLGFGKNPSVRKIAVSVRPTTSYFKQTVSRTAPPKFLTSLFQKLVAECPEN